MYGQGQWGGLGSGSNGLLPGLVPVAAGAGGAGGLVLEGGLGAICVGSGVCEAVAIGAGVIAIGVGVYEIGHIVFAQHGKGNVADSGVAAAVQEMVEQAKKAGQNLDRCDALALLEAAARQARNNALLQKIKATQKAWGCRASRLGR